ncbi:MAG: acyl-CoA dehydrogenase family protein [Janthinobacterium lividum]
MSESSQSVAPATGALAESEALEMLRDAARAMLLAEWPQARAVAAAEQAAEVQRLYRRAASQGWTDIEPDASELGLQAALALQQELGRAACPIPLWEAVLANAVLSGIELPAAAALRRAVAQGDAAISWVFAPADTEANAAVLRVSEGPKLRLDGRASFVESTALATHLLVVTGVPGQVAIIARNAPGLNVTPTAGLSTPALADVRFEAVEALAYFNAAFDLHALLPLARLMLSARAVGAAQYGLEMLTDYAKVRSQFGKKIGQYQAIQHKLANCLISVEVCRLSVQRAGTSLAGSVDGNYAAAVAAANAGHLLRQVVLELHHGFGGVSFWDEHELPRHFRRIHGDLTRLGGVHAARREVGNALLGAPAGSRMPDLDLGERVNRFRMEVRAWLDENWDHQYPPETEQMPVNHKKARQDFSRKVGKKGWLGLTWPKAYGGQERSALEHLAFEEEMAHAEAPVTFHNTAANMIGPALVDFGSPSQKEYFLPGIATGEISFALGYSEPDHGSDLAGMRTAATRTPDGGWSIRGQKIYTSTAGFSTHVWLAARTDPTQPRQGGISVFAVPLDTPGITMHPMKGLNDHRANVVFYDDVKLPADALVGPENGGWQVITAALAYERVTLAAIAARARGYFDRLVDYLRGAYRGGKAMAEDSLIIDRIGALAAEIEGARLLAVQTAQLMEKGGVPVAQAAMVKVYASELMERLSEAAFDLLGAGATLKEGIDGALIDGCFEYGIRDALLYTIGGGTNEIQRTLIALRGLDLPR